LFFAVDLNLADCSGIIALAPEFIRLTKEILSLKLRFVGGGNHLLTPLWTLVSRWQHRVGMLV
jgi:hypothetical protein